mmetsp:Transcript_13200/g.31252  ORF Transcript_13200/g.31252 Transcript_13200/m.31252 type:complete len:564 (+) Transcript_13200:192-1883(+)
MDSPAAGGGNGPTASSASPAQQQQGCSQLQAQQDGNMGFRNGPMQQNQHNQGWDGQGGLGGGMGMQRQRSFSNVMQGGGAGGMNGAPMGGMNPNGMQGMQGMMRMGSGGMRQQGMGGGMGNMGSMGNMGQGPSPRDSPAANTGQGGNMFSSGFKMTPTTRLLQYTNTQRRRPQDNNLEFWRMFVQEFFAPGSLMRWCVSSNSKSSGARTMVSSVEALPRLFQVKYESGLMEELLFLGQPQELYLPNGHIIVLFESLMEEAVFEELRVIRVGKLRILFNSMMKMRLWEFSIDGHCNLVPHRLILGKLQRLKDMNVEIQKRAMTVLNRSNQTPQQQEQILQGTIQEMLMLTNQMASSMEQVCVNDHGYSKRFMRSLQVADVINILQDLFVMCEQNPDMGPIATLQAYAQDYAKTHEMHGPVHEGMPGGHDMAPDAMIGGQMGMDMMGSPIEVQSNMSAWSPALRNQAMNMPMGQEDAMLSPQMMGGGGGGGPQMMPRGMMQGGQGMSAGYSPGMMGGGGGGNGGMMNGMMNGMYQGQMMGGMGMQHQMAGMQHGQGSPGLGHGPM